MSTQHPAAGTPAPLPELSDERIDEIEDALFSDIARERSQRSARGRRRSRLWVAGGAAAAVIVVAAVIAPSVGQLVGGAGGASDQSAVAPLAPADSDGGGAAFDAPAEESRGPEGLTTAPGASDDASGVAQSERDIITTATATVEVDDADAAARSIGNSAVAHGGYVESMSVGRDGSVQPLEPMEGGVVYDSSYPYPYPVPTDGAWITVRVPADELASVIGELDDVGEVTASSVDRQDVTEQTVDLQARIDAAQASVDRLTDLMAQAETVADLLTAESALSERQAQLESYQQQLEMLDDQVAMSTLSVTVVPEVDIVAADPAGFGDGLAAGWNGLVATLNGIVVAIGFLIPWLAVAAFAALLVWGIVHLVRGRRRQSRTADGSTPTPASAAEAHEDRPQ